MPREFVGRSTQQVLEEIKRSLGPDAVIVSTTERRGEDGSETEGRIVGIAACRPQEVTPRAPADGSMSVPMPDAEVGPLESPAATRASGRRFPSLAPLWRVADGIRERGVSEALARELFEDLLRIVTADAFADERSLGDALADAIAARCPAPATIHVAPNRVRRVALVGPSGAGKTAAIVKLAASLIERAGAVRVGALETGTAGLDRLGALAEVLGVAVRPVATPRDWKALASGLRAGVLLLDTPPVSAASPDRVARLKTFLAEAGVDETHVVLPATLDPDEGTDLLDEFRDAPGARLLITKIDEARVVGRVLNRVLGERRATSYLSVGRFAPEEILPAGPEAFRALAGKLLADTPPPSRGSARRSS